MERLKKHFLSLFSTQIILVMLFLCGCAAVEKKSAENIPVDSKTTQKVMITTTIRDMPDSCKPGDIVKVSLRTIPAAEVSGVIITEKTPDGWQIIKAEPGFTKALSDGTYKWLQWAKQVEPFNIIYEVKIPESAKGKYTFSGITTTYREGEIEITGKKEIIVK